MPFSELLQGAWTRHAEHTEAVYDELSTMILAAETEADLGGIIGLISHVAGEHLGRLVEAERLIASVRTHPAFQPAGSSGASAARSLAALSLVRGDAAASQQWMATLPPNALPAGSDQARVLTAAAALVAGQERWSEAGHLLNQADRALVYGPGATDPAARAMAVTSNNLAAALEEHPTRSPEVDALMLDAARYARHYWEIAGTWLHVERAEYRLARSLVVAGLADEAIEAAFECLEICDANQAPAEERFFGEEALALAHLAAGVPVGARAARERMAALLPEVPADWAEHCQGALAALDAKIGA